MDEDAGFAEFSQAWRELLTAVVRARGRSTTTSERELTLAQVLLLQIVSDLDHPSVGQISQVAGIASPSATRMLQQLERKGMVVRHRSERDERLTSVTVTEAGATALEAHLEHVWSRQRRVFSGVDPRVRRELIASIRSMRDAIDGI
ncbi:MAG: MarR family transcriptional regulator [Nocardiopsaceae bacterium]|nr:MarR family transcriptional regulator [Nocardiopsaceae bacterium]